jgi:hypothetical protein
VEQQYSSRRQVAEVEEWANAEVEAVRAAAAQQTTQQRQETDYW